jgi:hypothetical protein
VPQIRIADQHLAGTLLECLLEQRLPRRAPHRGPEHQEPFGLRIGSGIILEKNRTFRDFLTAVLR